MANDKLENEKLQYEIIELKRNGHWLNRFWNKTAGLLTLAVSIATVLLLKQGGAFAFQTKELQAREALLRLEVKELEITKRTLTSDTSALVKEINKLRNSVKAGKGDIVAANKNLSKVKGDLNTAQNNLNETNRKKRFNDSLYTSLWKNARAQAYAALKEIDIVKDEDRAEQYKQMQAHRRMETFWNFEIAKLKTQLQECEAKLKTNP